MSAQPLPAEPVEAALEAVKRLDQALRSVCGNNLSADSLARRAKDTPQLILQSGLVPTLAFMLSKLDKQSARGAYSEAIRVVLGETATPNENICSELGSSERGGYPHMAALLVAYAAVLAGCDTARVGRLDSGLIECLEKIRGKGARVERLVLSYSEEAKKLLTALYS